MNFLFGPRVYLRAISCHGCSPDTHIFHLCSLFLMPSVKHPLFLEGEKGTRLEIFLVSQHRVGCDSFSVRMSEQRDLLQDVCSPESGLSRVGFDICCWSTIGES